LLHRELSYRIRGLLYEVHNELGRFANEQQCGDSFEEKLKRQGINYIREFVIPSSFEGERKGRNKIDFLIEGKIIVELKHVKFLTKDNYYQCQRYLKATRLELALLVNFRSTYLNIKRVLNYQQYNGSHP